MDLVWTVIGYLTLIALGSFVSFLIWSVLKGFGRFQMHLSTALLLMFTAGGLMWANMTENGPQEVYIIAWNGRARVVQYGWPLNATTEYRPVVIERGIGSFTSPLVVLNLGVAFGVLYLVWHISESWIRWRASRKLMSTGKV